MAVQLKRAIGFSALPFRRSCRVPPAVNASSPPRAEATSHKGGLPFTGTPGNVPPPSGLPRGATAPAEVGREHNAAVGGKEWDSGYNKNVHSKERDGEASEAGGGDAGATSPGDDDKGDGKLGIDLSASFVRLELKEFRGRQALMVRMIAASLKPIGISCLRNVYAQPNGSNIHKGR